MASWRACWRPPTLSSWQVGGRAAALVLLWPKVRAQVSLGKTQVPLAGASAEMVSLLQMPPAGPAGPRPPSCRAGAAQQLPEEPAAVCREHQRKLAQAQAQVGRDPERWVSAEHGHSLAERVPPPHM